MNIKDQLTPPDNGGEKKSPLDNLKSRMRSYHTGDSDKLDTSPAGFTISNPDEENSESEIKMQIPEESESDKTVTEYEPEEAVKVEETTEIPPEESTEKKPKKKSLLKRIKHFTTDDNGVDVSQSKEPLYELEPVSEILGINPEDLPEEISEKEKPEETEETKKTDVLPSEETVTPFISDIDKPDDTATAENKPATADTGTIRFTPIKDGKGKKPTVSVDTMTHKIDLSGELTETASDEEVSNSSFEKSEFEKYSPEEEITDRKSEKKFIRAFAIKKRNRFLTAAISGILCFVLLIFLLPPITNSMLLESKGLMTASAIMLGVIILLNADMFLSLGKISSGKAGSDIIAILSTVSTVLLAIFSIMNDIDSFPMIFLCAFMLFIRSLTEYYNVSNILGNLRIISVNRPKKALIMISDNSTAMAIAKHSIDGDVLIASSRESDNIRGFMKYSTYDKKLSGKSSLLSAISLGIAVVAAVISGFLKHNIVEAFYISSVILSLSAVPVLFFIDSLPLRSMTDRLNRSGAMLNGFTAAERINSANAAVIRCCDLFPSGTVILKTMKVLSENNIDEVFLHAASITDALQSPLSSIFKQIAKTNASYEIPDSDTVKYEELLGISGWVDNKRFFIGNRTLMEAHDIKVPPLDVDRGILEKGYFPVYVAEGGVACALLVVKYTVDPMIAKQLSDAERLGITVLVETSDPNITRKMISDYFGVDENILYVMTSAGSNIHKTATKPVEECQSGAAYKGNSMSILRIMTSADRLKKSNTVLTVIYCIAAILGIIYFVYNSFLSDAMIIQRASTVLIYEIVVTAVSLMAFLLKRP